MMFLEKKLLLSFYDIFICNNVFTGLLLVCAMTHEGNVMTEQKVVLGHTRDNFTVATAALAPCRLLILWFCLPFFLLLIFYEYLHLNFCNMLVIVFTLIHQLFLSKVSKKASLFSGKKQEVNVIYTYTRALTHIHMHIHQ